MLIINSYHPKCFKEATGIILKKSQITKSPYKNYALPKAYKIISLLNCLAKVIEKIVTRRLAIMAEFKTLLYIHQIGGRRQKSAINAVIILIQKVQANWRTRKKNSITSVLALDVKNAYLTVRAAPFAKICIQLKFPTELIKWFISFISDRIIRFAFDGKINAIVSVNNDISQGSPVSPIMFLIFIQYVIRALKQTNEIVILSYANDFTIVTESSCARINSIRL
jgi:hypothetical protein